ncbi:MAG: membrane-bound serine protease (ClpP class) [Myxococcota bacterium]|jgi:membrane-bound serine protease (ClpP class)
MDPLVYAALFIMLGVVLIGVELKLVPGFGLIGLFGFTVAFYGGYLAVADYGATGALVSIISAAFAVVLIILLVRSRFSQKLVLEKATRGQPSSLPEETEHWIGKRGTASTPLRPSGMGRFDGQRVDVVSDNAVFIEVGATIIVVRVAQNSIIVKQLQGET